MQLLTPARMLGRTGMESQSTLKDNTRDNAHASNCITMPQEQLLGLPQRVGHIGIDGNRTVTATATTSHNRYTDGGPTMPQYVCDRYCSVRTNPL